MSFKSTFRSRSTCPFSSSILIVFLLFVLSSTVTIQNHSLVNGFTPISSSVLSHRVSSPTPWTPTSTTTITSASTSTSTQLSLALDPTTTTTTILSSITTITREQAEQLAGPFFGLSLFPYLLFLYFLSYPSNNTPKGITVGFTTCLLFVFLTIPAAIAAEILYGVSLADCDWLHGSAESMLTITNLVTVLGFRQAFQGKELEQQQQNGGNENENNSTPEPPLSVTSYQPMIVLVTILTFIAGLTAFVPAIMNPEVHTPYLNGFMDLPYNSMKDVFGGITSSGVLNVQDEPENALTVGCWIIHISSLIEFLVAMGFAWRWADIIQNPKWKGLTWGLLPLHTSGITACTYHLFYNTIPFLVPLQAFLTCLGNTTAGYAAYRIAISNGWSWEKDGLDLWESLKFWEKNATSSTEGQEERKEVEQGVIPSSSSTLSPPQTTAFVVEREESPSLIGFEDLGDALANDTDYTFLIKLFAGCAVASYGIKYGELFFDFGGVGGAGGVDDAISRLFLALGFIFIPSLLNAFKWYKRSLDPTFEGWF